MASLPEEFNKKGTYSLGLLAFIAIIAFSLGGTVSKVLSSENRFEDAITSLKNEMIKEDNLIRKEIETNKKNETKENKRIEDKITRKVQNHSLIEH